MTVGLTVFPAALVPGAVFVLITAFAILQTVFPFAGVNTVFAGQLAFAFSPAFDQLPLIGIGDNAID